MEMHFATVWESIADAVPAHPALIHGPLTRSWRDFDTRAARLATGLASAGITVGSKIGLFLYNGPEYLEAQYAGFKMRAVPVNVNYRYLNDELAYLLDNADAEALIFHSSLSERVAQVRDRLPKLRFLVQVDDVNDGRPILDGAVAYEDVIANHAPAARIERHEDDIYMLYTGGTTGMPKGVMYAMGGMTNAFVQGGFPLIGLAPPANASEVAPLVAEVVRTGAAQVALPTCPLMHGTGMWLGALIPLLSGGTIVTLENHNFDGHEAMRAIEVNHVSTLVVVGDAMCRPLTRAVDEAVERDMPYDTSSLKMMISSGVMWTSETKEEVLDRIPHIMLLDAMGSSEGSMGMQVSAKGMAAETAKFQQTPTTKVFTEDDREIVPGSGEAGLVAAGGNVPLGYYKDPEKSARTFRVINGERYSFPGDWATVDADGSIRLLGRGSQCINTGGEKVFPEEVEEAVKRTEGVLDCLVVGLPDAKFGEAVTAVVSLEGGGARPDGPAIIQSVKAQLSGFKAPKRVVFVTDVPRTPNGKADYKTAKQLALES